MFRRVILQRRAYEERGEEFPEDQLGPLYHRLMDKTRKILGPPRGTPLAHTTGTRDGVGVIFIAYNGTVYPSGFLPVPLGNIRTMSLAEIYREHPILLRLRSGGLEGRCGRCEYKMICGGSRARAYAYTGNPFAEDPACPYVPGS